MVCTFYLLSTRQHTAAFLLGHRGITSGGDLIALAGALRARLLAASIALRLQVLDAGLLGLGLVDVLHQHALVLELVTLHLQVQRVVPARARITKYRNEKGQQKNEQYE